MSVGTQTVRTPEIATQTNPAKPAELRVALVTSFPVDPAHPHGGVEAVSVVLAQALARLDDLDVHVVTTDPACPAPQRRAWEGVTVHRLPRRGRWTLTDALGSGRRTVCRYLETLKPDVIHAHDTYGLMVKGLPLPRVFTVHGFIHGDTEVAGGRLAWLRAKLWRRVETAGWADQPHIVSISPYVRERLSGIATGVIHDIDNPIAPAFFDTPRRERTGTIFSAALICRRKNPLALVEALAELVRGGCHAELRLAGAISEPDYGEQLRQRIVALGLKERVHLLGPLGSEQVRAELAAASVFALVSLEEGSPMGVEEAMAVGVPVVTSNRCGMPYMVRDGESGFLVNPHDPQDIAERLEQLLSDDELRGRMSATARRIAQDRFHPNVVAQRTRAVYRRAAEAQHRGSGSAHD